MFILATHAKRTKFLSPVESVRLGQFSMVIEVFKTSVDINIISTHSPLHDNRRSFPILKCLCVTVNAS